MVKANLTLPGGAKVAIEGTHQEVASVLEKFSISTEEPSVRGGRGLPNTSLPTKPSRVKKTSRPRPSHPRGPIGHIRHLKDEGFFNNKRIIGDIQNKLEEKGHIYALTSLSPALIRLVRARVLGRLKEGGVWKYVNR